MYVCNCKGVTERAIREAIEEGMCTRRKIAQCLKVGTACGKCTPEVRQLIKRASGETSLANLLRDRSSESFVLPSSPGEDRQSDRVPAAAQQFEAPNSGNSHRKGFQGAEPGRVQG